MYTIGELSKLSNLSVKTLRFYDQEKILEPEIRDPATGYRHYSEKQLMQVILIKDLKTFGLSLEEIKSVMLTEDIGYLEKKLAKRIESLEAELDKLQYQLSATKFAFERLKQGNELLNGAAAPNDIIIKKVNSQRQQYAVEVAMFQPMWVLFTRYQSYLNADTLFLDRVLELQHMRDKYGLFHCGSFMALFHDGYVSQFIKDEGDLEVFLPVLKPENTDIPELKLWDAGLCASTIHFGHYKDALRAYLTLQEWTEQNGYDVIGPPIEWYLLDSSWTSNSNYYITRISFPVAKVK